LSPPETQREIVPANAAPSRTELNAVLHTLVLLAFRHRLWRPTRTRALLQKSRW
jgi:hypothetical protein